MKALQLFSLLLVSSVAVIAADSETAEEKAAREARVKARLAEHAERKAEADQPAATAQAEPAENPEPTTTSQTGDEVDPVTMLPEYTVSSSRISELDIEIRKLEKQITRQKKKLKPSELDETINSDEAPKALLIFGGKTAGQRKSVAAERVHLMEVELDILEAMKHVRTKKDEDQLKEQLNAFKTMRRELDESLR